MIMIVDYENDKIIGKNIPDFETAWEIGIDYFMKLWDMPETYHDGFVMEGDSLIHVDGEYDGFSLTFLVFDMIAYKLDAETSEYS